MKKVYNLIAALLLTFPCTVASVQIPFNENYYRTQITHEKEIHELTNTIVDRHNVDWNLAYNIVKTAQQYERHTFPQAEDILAVVDIESRFNPHAKRSTQIGLAQIDYKVWRKQVNKHDLYTIDGSIRQCANILDQYYKQTGSEKGAIMAYNVGITAYKNGARPVSYYNKFKQAEHQYN